MPRHLAIDSNYVSGTISMNGTKVATAYFKNADGQPVLFSKAPRLTLTLLNASQASPFKTQDVKTGNLFIGFKIGFGSNVTLDIEWVASERA